MNNIDIDNMIQNPEKFFTKKQFYEMVKNYKKNTSGNVKVNVQEKSMRTHVFTDGACSKNGKKNSCAGYGVFFGDNDSRNISKKIEGVKQTNNLAELSAISECVKTLKEDGHYNIVSDSMYSINCLTKWYPKWEKNNWKTAKGTDVLNKDVIIETLKNMKNKDIKFVHINSHQDEPSNTEGLAYFLWYGNKMADKLATSSMN